MATKFYTVCFSKAFYEFYISKCHKETMSSRMYWHSFLVTITENNTEQDYIAFCKPQIDDDTELMLFWKTAFPKKTMKI